MHINKTSRGIKFPFSRPKEVVGVDIGSYSVKVVQLISSNNRWSLDRFASKTIVFPNQPEMNPVERKQIAIEAIKNIIQEQKITAKDAVTSVSGNSVIVRYVKFPKHTREELSQTIQFEAEPFIPFPIQDVNIGFHILGDAMENGVQKMDTILVAAKKEMVQNKVDILTDAGLRPVIVDVDAFALENAMSVNATEEELKNVYLVINCGMSTTNINIVENGISRVVRDVFISSSSFTKAIQRNLQMGWEQAEEQKLKSAILLTSQEKEKLMTADDNVAYQVSTALISPARELATECQRSIDFFQTQSSEEKTINKIYLCGGGGLLKGLDKYIESQVHIPVEIYNPLSRIADSDVLSAEAGIFSQYAVAVGLATRKRGDAE